MHMLSQKDGLDAKYVIKNVFYNVLKFPVHIFSNRKQTCEVFFNE